MKKYIILGICLFLIVILAAWLRIAMPYNAVFGSSETRFLTVDAYEHMRMADWSYDNFPSVMKYDAYLTYPNGAVIGARPMFSWIIAGLALLFGTSVDTIGAWLPPILFMLLLIPVFIIGWQLFGKWAGVISCFLVTIMPGELLGRTQLGLTDHDVLELLLMLLVLMFFILATRKNWLYSIGAGISLGLYNLNWVGAPTLTLILLIYLVVQSLIDNYRRQDNTRLYLSAIVMFGIGFLGYLVTIPKANMTELTYAIMFIAAIAIPAYIVGMLKLSKRFGLHYYIAALIVPIILAIAVLFIINPALPTHFFSLFIGAFVPMSHGLGMTISEMMPLLWYRGVFSIDVAWAYYGTCSVLGIIGLIWLLRKHGKEPSTLMFSIWAIFTIILVMLQRRYGYYAAVSFGMLTGYIVWTVCKSVSVRSLSRQQRKQGKSVVRYDGAIISGLIVLFIVVAPIFIGAKATANQTPYMLTNSWSQGLHWIKDNTPTVLETSGKVPEGTDNIGNVPTNSGHDEVKGYSVISWWDYGYWIVREAKRPVVVHPGGGRLLETSLFLLCKEDNQEYMNWYTDYFKVKYAIIDYQMVTGKFYAVPEIARSADSYPPELESTANRIKQYTQEDMQQTLMMKLYNTNEFDNWKLVWQSQQVYDGKPEVKIFELKGNDNG